MPLILTRTPTIYSLNQLDADEPGCPLAAPAKGVLSTPDKAVRELAAGSSLLPLYTFPSADGFASKKVRSFGSFQDLAGAGASSGGAAVPDVDEEGGLLGASDDDALSQDGSSDSGTQVGRAGRGGRGQVVAARACEACRLKRAQPHWGWMVDAAVASLWAAGASAVQLIANTLPHHRRCRLTPPAAQVVPQRSVLDALLLGEWEDRAEAGLFRYDVTACPTKLVRVLAGCGSALASSSCQVMACVAGSV